MKKFKVSAPGKVILSGEHAVVYGYPALLSAVNKRLTITRAGDQNEIESNIPIGCGMGSSAAFAVVFSALNLLAKQEKWDLERINKEAYKIEKKIHGNPSGGDNTISTYGGYLWYRRESESLKLFKNLQVKGKLPEFFVVNTGKPVESTGEMVSSFVASRYKSNRKTIEEIFRGMEAVTRGFLGILLNEKGSSFKELINQNEILLEKLGVVSNSTKELVRRIERLGGAAKISGAGGRRENSGILIVYHSDGEKLMNFAKKNNLEISKLKLGEEGVRIEKKK
jgi:mevalonate kinase